MDCKVAAVTAKLAAPDLPPNAAVILAFPVAIPVAKPVESTVTELGLDEAQIAAVAVMACEVPSE